MTEGARQTHGISDEELRDQPTLDLVRPAFRKFCGDDILVAHNGNGFDFPILRRLGDELVEGGDFVTFDSLPLARALHPGSRKLGDLAHHFGIELPQAHRAYEDARVLALVFRPPSSRKAGPGTEDRIGTPAGLSGAGARLVGSGTAHRRGGAFWKISRTFAMGRYSDCLEYYRLPRAAPGAFDAPSMEQVIGELGGSASWNGAQGESRRRTLSGAMARIRRCSTPHPNPR